MAPSHTTTGSLSHDRWLWHDRVALKASNTQADPYSNAQVCPSLLIMTRTRADLAVAQSASIENVKFDRGSADENHIATMT